MVIQIRKSDNPEYKDTLKVSSLLPFEYVIVSKTEYKNPLIGEGKYGEWNKYEFTVHEFKTQDPNTGEITHEKPEQVCGFFSSGASLIPKLLDIEVGQKFKITQEQPEGKAYKMYKVEVINDDGTLTLIKGKKSLNKTSHSPEQVTKNVDTPTNGVQSMSLDDKIKKMKDNSLFSDDVAEGLAKEFDTTVEFVKMRAEAL